MALQEFTGELDAPKLKEFTGGLDGESSAFDGVSSLIKSLFAPKPESVLQSLPADPAAFDFAASSKLNRRLDDNAQRQKDFGTIGPIVGPQPSATSIINGLFTDVVAGGKGARAGINQIAGDMAGSEYLQNQARRERGQVDLMTAVNTPEFESDTARAVYGGLSSTARMIPSLAAAVVTRNPQLALGGMVAPMVPDAYGKYRQRGATPGEALPAAIGEAGIEYFTEKMPMGFLVKNFGKVGATKMITGFIARDALPEQVATLTQDAIDTAVANPDKTWGEYMAERPGAAYQTLVATGTQAGLMGGANAAMNRLSRGQSTEPTIEDYQAAVQKIFGTGQAPTAQQAAVTQPQATQTAPSVPPPQQGEQAPQQTIQSLAQLIASTAIQDSPLNTQPSPVLPPVIDPLNGNSVEPTDPRYVDVVNAKGSAAPEEARAHVAKLTPVADDIQLDTEPANGTANVLYPVDSVDLGSGAPIADAGVATPQGIRDAGKLDLTGNAATEPEVRTAPLGPAGQLPKQVTAATAQPATDVTAPKTGYIGQDGAGIDDGGTPFKTKQAAQKAKKLQPMMRVKKVQGGFVLADKTPAQLAAEEQAAKRIRGASGETGSKGKPMSAHEFIASRGGMAPGERSNLGIDGNVKVGNRWLIAGAGKGMTIAQATEALKEQGFLKEENERAAYDLIKRSVTNPQFTDEGWERMAELEMQTQYEDYLANQEETPPEDPFAPIHDLAYTQEDAIGFGEASPELQAEMAALIEAAEAEGIDFEQTLYEAARITENKTQDEYTKEAIGQLEAAIGASRKQPTENQDSQQGGQAAEPTSRGDGGQNDSEQGNTRGQAQSPSEEALTSYTPKDVEDRLAKLEQAEQERKQQEREAEQKAKADAERDTFTLTGSDRAADVAAAQGQQDIFGTPTQQDDTEEKQPTKPAKNSAPKSTAKSDNSTAITDFGEKIGGARKDVWTSFKDQLNEVNDADITEQPLSKVWPQPDYQTLIDNGTDSWAVAFIRAARDEIPAKPRAPYKVKRWAEQVKSLRSMANDVMAEDPAVRDKAKELFNSSSILKPLRGRVELYMEVGHSKSLEGITMEHNYYSLYRGEQNVHKWVISQRSTTFGNWPREIVATDTKEEAIAKFKEMHAALGSKADAKKQISFDIYSKHKVKGYFVGKKVGRNYIDLAGPFETVKEARTHKNDSQDELVAKLEKAKEIPMERRNINEPRVGEDMRNGQDVTPQEFGAAFGFRGVEFGNWVEQGRRQQDLNEAYDALMDMAALLDIPPKAISLNGELGLAFGARGGGGVNPAAAHYERDKVVINLTKKNGAGSLGHEWWHALDNYFSRQRKKSDGMMTDATDVQLASRGSKYFYQDKGVRQEMIDAFGRVMKSINATAIKARSSVLDGKRSKEYWTTDVEMSARAFESYLISRLQDQNASNDYLANIVSEDTWNAMAALGLELDSSYPYPTAGEIPEIRAGFDEFFKTIEHRETDKGIALFDIPHSSDNQFTRLPETARTNVLAKLKTLEKNLDAGKIDAEKYRAGVQDLIDRIQQRNETQLDRAVSKGRERGPEWITERLMRAKRKGELSEETVDFALWALAKNPALANDLAISLPEGKNTEASGDYNPASRVMRLFKSTASPTTAVHEILHHTERMMPVEIQNGILKEYQKAWDATWTKANEKTQKLMQDMLAASAGDAKAKERVMAGFRNGDINYEDHYQLYNASEFWAVNATDILAKRYAVEGSWVAKAKRWLAELAQYMKGALGLRSDAPILKALNAVMEGNGERITKTILSESNTVLNDQNDASLNRGKTTAMPSFDNASGNFNPDLDKYWIKQGQKEISGDRMSDAEYYTAIAEYANSWRINELLEKMGWRRRGSSNLSASTYYQKNIELDEPNADGEDLLTYEVRVTDHADYHPADGTIQKRFQVNFRSSTAPWADVDVTPDMSTEDAIAALDDLFSNEQFAPVFDGAQSNGIVEDIKRPDDQTELDLNEPGFDFEPINAKDAFSRELDASGRKQYVLGRKLYDRMATVATEYLGRVKLADNRPTEFKQMLRQFRVDQSKATESAKAIAEKGMDLTPEQRVLLSDMIENQVKVADVPPDEMVELAASITAALETQANDLVELGMLSKDRLVKDYLPRLYKTPLAAQLTNKQMFMSWFTKVRMRIRGARLQSRGLVNEVPIEKVKLAEKLGWKVSSLADGDNLPQNMLDVLKAGGKIPDKYKGTKIIMWRDFTESERKDMGEVRDAVLRYAMGYVETQRDVAVGRLFKAVANNIDLAKTYNPGGWVQVPNTEIKGAPGTKTYGALAGMYVEPQVADSLKRNTQPKGVLMAAYDKALGWWKEGKTVWNPVSHGNNVVSNVFVMHFAGLNPANPIHWRNTVREYRSKGQYYKEAVDKGLFGNEFATLEIQNLLMPDLADMADIESVATSRVSKMAEFLKKTGKPVTWYRENMQRAYEFEDQFFKLMIYADRRKAGMTPTQAIEDTERYVFNYADMPEGVETIKRVYSPFFSYTYKAVPMIIHTAMHHPDRLIAPIALLAGANWLGYLISGGDEDKERKGLPDYMQGRSAIGTQKAIRMPFNVEGKPAFMDVTRRVPLGDLFDTSNQTNGLPVPAPLMPSHPLLSMTAAIAWNVDTFSGKDLVKKSDTGWEAAQTRAGYVYKQLAPNAPFVPGSYNFNKLMDSAAYTFDTEFGPYTGRTKAGDPIPLSTTLPDVFTGTKIRAIDPDRGLEYKRAEIDREMREVKANISSANRNQSMTDASRERYTQEQQEKIDELRKQKQSLR